MVLKQFEFDEGKSASNLDKHGIDFVAAQEIWERPYLEVAANVRGEKRTKTIGRIGGEVFVAIWTLRESSIRIISARKATRREAAQYDRAANYYD